MTHSPVFPHIRPDRAVISIAGEGALAFLHNLLTVDLLHIALGDVAYGALLTPQGKILHDVFLFVEKCRVLIDCSAMQADDLLKKLIMYRLRAKLEIKREPDLAVAVGAGARDPRLRDMGLRGVVGAGSLPLGDDGSYDAARLSLGLADSDTDIGSGELFVHEANLDQLHAVSFSKGCYVGQEVVSRTHHRGMARNRLFPLRVHGPLPQKGTAIMAGEIRVGEMRGGQGQQALGLMRVDRMAEAEQPYMVGETSVEAMMPKWMTP